MTPSTTFQCPLSPAGTFHPDRSLPSKRETKPLGAVLSAAHTWTPSNNPTRHSGTESRLTMMRLRLVQGLQDNDVGPIDYCSTAAGFVPGAASSEPRQ